MRRALSISLILLLCLPAVAAMLPGAGDRTILRIMNHAVNRRKDGGTRAHG